MNLTKLFSNIFDSSQEDEANFIKRSTILTYMEGIEFSVSSLLNNDLPLISDFFTSGEYKDLEKTFLKLVADVGIKTHDVQQAISMLESKFMKVNTYLHKELLPDIEKEIPETLAIDGMTNKQTAILGMVKYIYANTEFASDYITYVIYKLNGDEFLHKAKEKQIQKGIKSFSRFLKDDLKDRFKDLSKITDNVITESFADFKLHATKPEIKFDLPIDGFNGSPIFFLQKIWVDFKHERYEARKDKKKLLELKLQDLKLRQSGNPDPKLQKQIEYYEDRIESLEYNIKQYEES